ncbi:hypothetical protein HPB51_009894 [Rhipicephalus microplus]|uniref:Ubiquitin-like protein ATG12 n=1 Tax=Rhipicephalus microplus TaxID=6941 RepID=A0A9J6ES26_RHIMP|nr:hypothetical protein HPB51_009894 [Rhipicephalus microplus]
MSEQPEETESPVTDSGNHDNAAEDNTSEACASPEKTEARKDRGDSVGSNSTDKKKIDVFLKATGDAPIMAKRKWAVSPTSKVMDIVDFVRRYLKLDQSESLDCCTCLASFGSSEWPPQPLLAAGTLM